MDNLPTLKAGGFTTTFSLGVSFASQVFVIDRIAAQLIADSSFAASKGSSNLSDAIPFVIENLDFVTFVLGEVDVVLSFYQSMCLSSNHDNLSKLVKIDQLKT